MTEVNVIQVRVDNRLQRFGGGFVGEMAVTAGNSLLQTPRPARIVLKHLQVVIGFQDENVGGAHALANESRGVAEIGEKTDFVTARVQQKSNRIIRVMRD